MDRAIVRSTNGTRIIINGVDRGFGTTDTDITCHGKPTFDTSSPFQYVGVKLKRRYSLLIDEERRQFWNEIIASDYIDGYSISLEMYKKCDFETFSDSIVRFFSQFKHPQDLNCCIYPFHIIRASEVEKFYEYTSSVVINGIECDKYFDAEVGTPDYHDTYPGYIEVGGTKYKDVIATISQEDLKWITVGNAKDGIGKFYIIPKKYIDKIILRRKYLHPDLIEFCLEKFYTGEEDVFELDPKNPDPEVLNMMIEYSVVCFHVDEKRDTIKSISNKKTLVIDGNEYDAVRNNGGTIVLCRDLMTGYDKNDALGTERLYNDLKNNTFVHGLYKDSLYENLSLEDYMTLMQSAKKEADERNIPLHQVICPFHRVRQSEVEAFCEYESSIVLGKWYNEESWVECKKILDLNCLQPGYSETYPEYVLVDAESSEILCKTLDSWQQKKITINDVENDKTREITTFRKGALRQIKLYRRYLDTSNIEHSLEAPYTGKEEEFVLNTSEIYPKDLELMRKYGVIVENELK